jgi:hypothetical protein
MLDGSLSYDSNMDASLTYVWACIIISLGSNFSSGCNLFTSSVAANSILTVPAGKMSDTIIYRFTLYVYAEDGRSGSASVVVRPVNASVYVFGSDSSVSVNYDEKLSIGGYITANSSVAATWSASWDSELVSLSYSSKALTNPGRVFTSAQVRSTVQFPLGIAANALTAGKTYTFTLTGCEVVSPSSCSSFSMSVYVNGPPNLGSIEVAPQQGYSLSQEFAISALNWIDEAVDYPLWYRFQYQRLATSAIMMLSSYSVQANAQTILPAGLAAQDYNVSLVVTIADNLGAAVSDSVAATVYQATGVNTTFLLSNGLKSFSSTGDSDAVTSLVNVLVTAINSVNCSFAPDCAGLHRYDCISTANTCGSCWSNYSGVAGDANTLCFPSNSTSGGLGAFCAVDSDCLYGLCTANMCVAPGKLCDSNCSQHGRCEYKDTSGSLHSSCSILDVRCNAICVCHSGYYGHDCSLDSVALSEIDSMRSSMCSALLAASKLQDSSAQLLDNMVSSLFEAYDPYEVLSSSAIENCEDLLSYLAAVAGDGYIASAESSTIQAFMDVISEFVASTQVSSGRRLSTSNISSVASDALSELTTGLITGLLPGESPILTASDNVRMNIQYPLVTSMNNATISPPSTAEESQYGSLLPSIVLAESGLEACNFEGGYAPIVVTSWGINPFSTELSLQSSLFTMSTRSSLASRRRSLAETIDVPLSFAPLYYITLQFSSTLELNFTAQRLGVTKANITLPECTFYDGSDYSTCQGCNISSYSEYNVTYACHDLSVLCSGADARIRHLSRRLQVVETKANYASRSESLAMETVSESSINPFARSLDQSKPALIFDGSFLFALIFGIILLIPADIKERNRILYAQDGSKQPMKATKSDSTVATIISEAFSLRGWYHPKVQHLDDSDQKNKDELNLDAEFGVSIDEVASDSKDVQSFSLNNSSREKSLGVILDKIDAFMEYVLPSESLLKSDGIGRKFLRGLHTNHEYVTIFTEYNPQLSRAIRWASLWKSILICLFVDTVFFEVYYPSNSVCYAQVSEDLCSSVHSGVSLSNHECTWSSTGCTQTPPSKSITFIIVLATLCVIISLPIDLLLTFMIEEFCAKYPDVTEIGLSAQWLRKPTFAAADRRKAASLAATLTPPGGLSSLEKIVAAQATFADLLPVDEEVQYIINSVRSSICADIEAPQWHSAGDSLLECSASARARAIFNNLRIYPNGDLAPLSTLSWLKYGTALSAMQVKLERVRAKSEKNWRRICLYEDNAEEFKNYCLLQLFILEQMMPFKRFALKKLLQFHRGMTQDLTSCIEFTLGWLLVAGTLGFFYSWVFAWGLRNQSTQTLQSWGINFGVGVAQDILVLNPIKILILFVLSTELMQPQLKSIHRTLSSVAIRAAQGPSFLEYDFSVCQHMSAACRTARRSGASSLPSAQLLQLIRDEDVEQCRYGRYDNGRYFLQAIVAMPAVLALGGAAVGEFALATFANFFVAGIIVLLAMLDNAYGSTILIIPIVLVLVIAIYRTSLVQLSARRMQRYAMKKQRSMWTPRLAKQRVGVLVRAKRWTLNRLSRLIVAINDPVPTIQNVLGKTKAVQQATRWQLMNGLRGPGTMPENADLAQVGFIREGSLASTETAGLRRKVASRRSSAQIVFPKEIIAMMSKSSIVADSDSVLRDPSNDEFGLSPRAREVFTSRYGAANAAAFKHRQKVFTDQVDVALKRMLGDIGETGETGINGPIEQMYFGSLLSQSAVTSIRTSDLLPRFHSVWQTYFPSGYRLHNEEIEHLSEALLAWATEVVADTEVDVDNLDTVVDAIPVAKFIHWFKETVRDVVSIKIRQQSQRFTRTDIDALDADGDDDASSDDYSEFLNLTTIGSTSLPPVGLPSLAPPLLWAQMDDDYEGIVEDDTGRTKDSDRTELATYEVARDSSRTPNDTVGAQEVEVFEAARRKRVNTETWDHRLPGLQEPSVKAGHSSGKTRSASRSMDSSDEDVGSSDFDEHDLWEFMSGYTGAPPPISPPAVTPTPREPMMMGPDVVNSVPLLLPPGTSLAQQAKNEKMLRIINYSRSVGASPNLAQQPAPKINYRPSLTVDEVSKLPLIENIYNFDDVDDDDEDEQYVSMLLSEATGGDLPPDHGKVSDKHSHAEHGMNRSRSLSFSNSSVGDSVCGDSIMGLRTCSSDEELGYMHSPQSPMIRTGDDEASANAVF